jgi:hypothetical protein
MVGAHARGILEQTALGSSGMRNDTDSIRIAFETPV